MMPMTLAEPVPTQPLAVARSPLALARELSLLALVTADPAQALAAVRSPLALAQEQSVAAEDRFSWGARA